MTIKLRFQEFRWMATGAALLLVVILIVLHFQTGQSATEQVAFKAQRADLVGRMRLTLASAADDGCVVLWNVAAGAARRTLPGRCAVYTPDGTRLLFVRDGRLWLAPIGFGKPMMIGRVGWAANPTRSLTWKSRGRRERRRW